MENEVKACACGAPSRNGKTIWARAHGPHAYFGGLFSLEEPIEGVSYAVFDDINGGLPFFPQYKWWLGHQKQFYATDKYKGKKLIYWGRPQYGSAITTHERNTGQTLIG